MPVRRIIKKAANAVFAPASASLWRRPSAIFPSFNSCPATTSGCSDFLHVQQHRRFYCTSSISSASNSTGDDDGVQVTMVAKADPFVKSRLLNLVKRQNTSSSPTASTITFETSEFDETTFVGKAVLSAPSLLLDPTGGRARRRHALREDARRAGYRRFRP